MIVADHRFFIIDYKTARYTGNQDSLLPIYRVQLNGYAWILEKLGMGNVGGLVLCYYEPITATGNLVPVEIEEGFRMPFRPHLLEIGLDPAGVVLPLLGEVRRHAAVLQAPKSREGCSDCQILEQVIGLVS